MLFCTWLLLRGAMASQVILPKLTYEMQEGLIIEWLLEVGEDVSSGQTLFVVESDKAAVEVPAEQSGIILKVLVPAGEIVAVGTPLAWIGEPGETVPEIDSTKLKGVPGVDRPRSEDEPHSKPPRAVAATPVAKRLARELRIDLQEVATQVGQKRIREADVKAFADSHRAGKLEPEPVIPEGPDFDLVAPTPLQRAMASHMQLAAAIPQSTASCNVDLSNLEKLRNLLREDWKSSHDVSLTYTHLFSTLVVRTLESNPLLNGSWTEEGIRLYRQINLGIAMASERGLVVPVVRNSGDLSLLELANEIIRLQAAVERNRLLPQDLEGGTFTMTNVGMLGITLSIPAINPPQSGILAIGAIQDKLGWKDGQVVTSPYTTVTLTTDHRVIDGATAAAFLQRFKEITEDPQSAIQ
jgi:pyruvate dehydrogenase E2 component (dihydrolipoamide acetyltransferase)